MTREQWILTVVLAVTFVGCLAVRIDLVTADIGRHIKNGEIILTGPSEDRSAVLTTNYYSYTEDAVPFVNHHWLFGVAAYVTHAAIGFSGLSILYIALMLAAFLLIYDLVRRKVGILGLGTISLLAIPLIVSRTEVRPEVVTYLFIALFIWLCVKYEEGGIGKKWLWFLPVLEIFWVNSHIGFVFGPFILGAFLVGLFFKKDIKRVTHLAYVLIVTGLVTLANPSFLTGVLYPFKIFGVYTYRVLENQSIGFLSNLSVGNSFTFGAYEVLALLVVISYALAIILSWRKVSLPILIITSVFGYIGWNAIREFPLFGIASMLSLSSNVAIIRASGRLNRLLTESNVIVAGIMLILIGAIFTIGLFISRIDRFGIGVDAHVGEAAKFFIDNGLKGPVFNNYDIGGYLIYGLFPREKVFFDNRPEAYSKNFVSHDYIAAMEDTKLFDELDARYGFNAVFYYYRDHTPWGQAFIIRAVYDDRWAPVYADSSIAILLKRSAENNEIIIKYELPKSAFRISQ
jgi:hypothetical protein